MTPAALINKHSRPLLPYTFLRNGLALAAFVCLLVVAVGLRFYDLPGNSVSFDEAVVANNSSGTLSEVVSNTRYSSSSPILYPLALWAVQKVDVSAFSIRVLPAMASVLTVAALLFLLPRAGVSRWAAFLAALLTTLSIAAIEHAQGAREYSIDALLAVLMIAGLLWYLRDGRKVLLCVSLFLAPLLQYGLTLFGVAVMGAAMVLPPRLLVSPESKSHTLSRICNWLKLRIALVWPAVCFLVGCAISYLVTLRYHWAEGGWGGYDFAYYQGAFDVADVLGFAAFRTWDLLNYHLPQVVAIPVVGALALMLMASLKRSRFDAIATLALLAVGIAIFAAMLKLYPLGGIRQNIYLGPVIFLAAGVAVHSMTDSLAALTHRAWLAPALAVAAAGAIALVGVGDIWQDSPYEDRTNFKAVLAFLEEHVEEGDMVYVFPYATPSMKFYQDEKPNSYHYGECWLAFEKCIPEMVGLVVSRPNVPNRIFLVHDRKSIREELELLRAQVSVEHIIGISLMDASTPDLRVRDLFFDERILGRFEDGLDGWLLEGEAVTNHGQNEHYRDQQPISGSAGRGFLTSYHPDKGDRTTGRALSPAFTADSDQYLTFLIAGGMGSGVGLRLLAVGGEAAVWRGEGTERFRRVVYSLAEVAGQRLQLELFDDETGGWGHIMLDDVMLVRRQSEDQSEES